MLLFVQASMLYRRTVFLSASQGLLFPYNIFHFKPRGRSVSFPPFALFGAGGSRSRLRTVFFKYLTIFVVYFVGDFFGVHIASTAGYRSVSCYMLGLSLASSRLYVGYNLNPFDSAEVQRREVTIENDD